MVRRVAVVEAGRQGRVEAEFGLGITVREVEGGGLIEREVSLWGVVRDRSEAKLAEGNARMDI